MDPLQIFECFQLDDLNQSWIDDVWDREFLSFPEPPTDYSILLGSDDITRTIKDSYHAIKKWANEGAYREDQQLPKEVSWQTLSALNLNAKGLLSVLGYLIKLGLSPDADEDSRQTSLAAASLYFVLLSIPGSNVFRIFHPGLYQRALETLNLSEFLVETKKSRKNNLESLYSMEPEGLTQNEKTTLVKGLNCILFDIISMLETFYMKDEMRSLEMTVMTLVKITALDSDRNHFLTQDRSSAATKTSLSWNAYVALQNLTDTRHGQPEDTIRLIMKHLMPNFFPANLQELTPKSANIVWDTMISFIKNLLNTKQGAAELGIEILVQKLLINCPDRSEARQKQAAVVSKLIHATEKELFLRNVKNLVMFSHNNKVAYRIFSQEILGKLLQDIPPDSAIKKVLVATILSRSVDVSNMVRGKALSVLETLINTESFEILNFYDRNGDEDKPLPSIKELLSAIDNDANPLPGSRIFISTLMDRIKDERALVRRSAMHCFHKVVAHFPEVLEKVVASIAHHCRDPTLTVRQTAIQILTDLLEKNGDNEKVLSEWVRNVLPRIFDVETKVQDKVLESVQNLVLGKIGANGESYSLPWNILRKLTDEKMRKNLSKICDFWIKNKVVSAKLIEKIQSFIGTSRNVEAWILLASIAEHLHLENIDRYFSNYSEIFKSRDFVSSLMLEVLRFSWPKMDPEFLERLFISIYENLCKYHVSLESIGTCVDIMRGIMERHKDTIYEKVETPIEDLIRHSEIRIDQLMEEQPEDLDVLPCSEDNVLIYLKAMCTLGHASLGVEGSVSETTIKILQGLLLDCDNLPNPMAYTHELKAAGIVILGQQALRDRDLAEEVMPIFGRLMCRSGESGSPAEAAMRVNAVKALADLCIRFTALVEPYLSDMCICMKDPDPKVREMIIVIFVQLLLEDYIKVKGAFFFHILTMLSDSDETIRDLTVFLIKERLLVKNKTLISQSFIKSLFHYNNCPTKHKFHERKIRQKEIEALTLPGLVNINKRRAIYDFMMEHLDPASKEKLLKKLTSDILEGACEKFIDLTREEGQCMLKDVLYIVSNDRLQPTYNSKAQEEDTLDDTLPNPEQTVKSALTNIVESMKQFKLKFMIPIAYKLRDHLSAVKSPLQEDVAEFVVSIISEFNKEQIRELFDEHPNLKKDFLRDKKRFAAKLRNNFFDEESSSSDEETTNINRNADSAPKSPVTQRINSALDKDHVSVWEKTPKIILRRLSSLTCEETQRLIKSPAPQDPEDDSTTLANE